MSDQELWDMAEANERAAKRELAKEARLDGGPAFPQLESHPFGGTLARGGMTLRDWFAGMVLQGEVASQDEGFTWSSGEDSQEMLVERCYNIADAMLKQRAK